MNDLELIMPYFRARASRFADRIAHDDRGSATAEQIVMMGAAAIGAAAVGVIIWQKMSDGANNIQTPSP